MEGLAGSQVLREVAGPYYHKELLVQNALKEDVGP